MTTLDRRAFMAVTAGSIASPTALSAKECPTAGMNWIAMSLQARNLAYNNVEHVGPDNARKKTETPPTQSQSSILQEHLLTVAPFRAQSQST
jgi:hypothetical protein